VPQFSKDDKAVLESDKYHLDHATKFIPGWVKVAVAIALGMGTMVGWRRIVITTDAAGRDCMGHMPHIK